MITSGLVNEFELDDQSKSEIATLLEAVFPGYANGRTFFKQLPNYRILLRDGNKLVGHLGVDYRVMNLNGEIVRVLGIKGLAVFPEYQGKGFGNRLMQEFLRVAETYSTNIDFAFLVTDIPAFYERFGFDVAILKTTWLKIHQDKSYGIGSETITDSVFMYKEISGKKWTDGELDMLGYMY